MDDPDMWFDIPVKTVVSGAVGGATIVGYLMGIGIMLLPFIIGCWFISVLCGVGI